MSLPLVSVVIPTYNRGYCIEKSIDSVLGQTHPRVDVIIIDDGSTDDTRERLRSRYGGDERVRYFYQENQGIAVARNHGLSQVRGSFVALHDSDDIWKPWKLELQLACLECAPEAGMIWTDMEAMDEEWRVIDPSYLRAYYSAYRWFTMEQLFTDSRPLPSLTSQIPTQVRTPRLYVGDIFSQMIMGNLVHPPTVLLRRERVEQVGNYNVALRGSGADFDFLLRTCRLGPVAYADVAAIEYRAGAPDQLTRPSLSLRRAQNFLSTIAPFIENERERIQLPDSMIHSVLAEAHEWIGSAALTAGERSTARTHLRKSLRYHPWQPRTAMLFTSSLLPESVEKRMRDVFRSAKAVAKAFKRKPS